MTDRGVLVGLVPGAPVIDRNINSLAIEAPFVEGTASSLASATVRWRPASGGEWRQAITAIVTRPGSPNAVYGKIVGLAANTAYQIETIMRDAADNRMLLVSTTTTRADPYVPASTLTATAFVRADGSDSNDGSADDAAHAWLTVGKAMTSAASGAVVQIGPGKFPITANLANPPSGPRSTPITLKAQFPCLDDSRAAINAGSETVLTPLTTLMTSPTASGGPNAGVWTSVNLTGPGDTANTGTNRDGNPVTAGGSYQVWKWVSGFTGTSVIQSMVWATSQYGTPTHVAVWKKDAVQLDDNLGWAEKLYTNRSYNYGWFVDSTVGDVYLRLPDDVDPNTLWITCANGVAHLNWSAADCRFTGFRMYGARFGMIPTGPAARSVIDHVDFVGVEHAIYQRGITTDVIPHGNGSALVAYCRHLQRGLRAPNGGVADMNIIPWPLIKGQIINADGTTYATTKIAGELERSFIGGRNGQGGWTVRNCTIDGAQNGIGTGGQDATPRYQGHNWDVHDCYFVNIQDDALEPEGVNIGFAAWDNSFDYCLDILSIGPISYGPCLFFRNRAWRFGPDGLATGGTWAGSGHPQGVGVKYGSTSSPRARLLMSHNVFWTDSVGQGTGVPGGSDAAGASSNDEELEAYNNIIRGSNYAYVGPRSIFLEDYNLFATTDASRGLRRNSGSTTYGSNVSSYRTATGNGAHTNNYDKVDHPFNAADWLDALLVDPTHGDLRMISPAVGVSVGGISDALGRDARIGYQP